MYVLCQFVFEIVFNDPFGMSGDMLSRPVHTDGALHLITRVVYCSSFQDATSVRVIGPKETMETSW